MSLKEKIERKDLLRYILLRLLIITSILIAAVIIQYSTGTDFPPIFILTVIIFYGLSLIYFLLYLWGKFLVFQAYLQLISDLMLITWLVYISGGMTTATYFLYIFAIIAASLVISEKATYLAAGLSAVLFGFLVDGTYFSLIPYFHPDQAVKQEFGSVLFNLILAWAVFFAVAFFMNYLSRSLRRTRHELQQAQKELILRERLAEAGRVSATLAHEIRNPLAAISSAVQVLKSEFKGNGDIGRMMEIIVRESNRVSQLLEQFLDFSAPSRKMFSQIDLGLLLNETLEMLRSSGELDGEKIRVDGNYLFRKITYYGHPNHFKQIYWNLIKNAIKAMPEGGKLSLNFYNSRRDGLKIVIADTGVGMSEQDKENLFVPFYSGFGEGRGLGLATVRKLVEDYDGQIQVNSEIGRGTEVIITLPLINEKRMEPN
ncbi:MAG: ATP-binding protein [Candidatus Saccharicenans sp.]|jgi:two-component system sensor histidine kinase PilS (NtrC family)|nr:ATP-binding protein [Candidatus Saccharicenans sp.]